MISPINKSLSALDAFAKKFENSARNTANAMSDGYRKKRISLQEGENGGVTAVETSPAPATQSASPSDVDLAGEMVQQKLSQHGYNANLKAIKTADEMIGTALDLFE